MTDKNSTVGVDNPNDHPYRTDHHTSLWWNLTVLVIQAIIVYSLLQGVLGH